jgi:CRP/FNR family transcriptional regulator, anaerobic regulatory protein
MSRAASTLESTRVLRSLIQRSCTLTKQAWADFESRLASRTLREGQHLVLPGQRSTRLGFIVRGAMRRYELYNGREITLGLLRPGSLVSDYAALTTGEPATQGLQALVGTDLVTIEIVELRRLAEQHDGWRAYCLAAGPLAVRRSDERMNRRIALSAGDRLIALLTEWPNVFQVVRKHHVAAYLGITPEHLSRILSRMSKPSVATRQGR